MPVHLPGTPHTARITLGYHKSAQVLNNVFYLEDTTDAIFTNPASTLTAIAIAVGADLLPRMFADIIFDSLTFEDVRTIPFGGMSIGITPGQPGALAVTAFMPNDVSLAVKKSTGHLGRAGRGRWFWPSMDPSALVDDNTVTAVFQAGIVGALQSFQTAVETALAPATMGIVSYYLNKVLRTAGVFYPITNWSAIDATVDSQRRRLPGRGR
jgi:hypothetical protein